MGLLNTLVQPANAPVRLRPEEPVVFPAHHVV